MKKEKSALPTEPKSIQSIPKTTPPNPQSISSISIDLKVNPLNTDPVPLNSNSTPSDLKPVHIDFKQQQEQLSVPMNFTISKTNPNLRAELLRHTELVSSVERVLQRLHKDPSDPLIDIELVQTGNLLTSISAILKEVPSLADVPDLHSIYTKLVGKLGSVSATLSNLSPQVKDKTYSRYLGCLL